MIEGNVFHQVKTPMLSDSSPGATFAVSSSDESTCKSKLGRTCVPNSLVQSGTLTGSDESVLSAMPKNESSVNVMAASRVRSSVLSNAGVGKLSSSSNSKRQFDRPFGRKPAPALSSAGPGASPAGPKPTWSWRTIGVRPTPSSFPTGFPTGWPTAFPTPTETPHGPPFGGQRGGGFPFGWF